MRFGFTFLSVFALVVFAIGGCGDVGTPTQMAPLNLTIQYTDGSTDPWPQWPLEGVQLCEGDTKQNCEISDASGRVTIHLPVGEIFVTLEKTGYDSLLIPLVHSEDGSTTSGIMWTTGLRAAFYEFYETVYPRDGRGEIKIDVRPIPFPGSTFDLVDATGKAYYDTDNPLDDTATNHFGIGGFLEVTPGTFEVKHGGTADRCAVDWGWPSGENSIRVPVRANHVSQVLLTCARP